MPKGEKVPEHPLTTASLPWSAAPALPPNAALICTLRYGMTAKESSKILSTRTLGQARHMRAEEDHGVHRPGVAAVFVADKAYDRLTRPLSDKDLERCLKHKHFGEQTARLSPARAVVARA